jgi:L-lactate utilization protein LutC
MDFKTLASTESIDKTVSALTERHFEPVVVATKEEALAKVIELIPDGVTLMNGASQTLAQIGFIDVLKNKTHGWRNLHDVILDEPDKAKQSLLRREAVVSDFYVGSVHAITEEGELVISSNSGSQLPHLAYTSPNIVLVVGAQKIVPTLADAFKRLDVEVIPQEDERMKKEHGYGTLHAKTLILRRENPAIGRKVHVLIVKDNLGF